MSFPCWREHHTGRNFLENDQGESEYFCPKCPAEFADKCRAGVPSPERQAWENRKNLNRWLR